MSKSELSGEQMVRAARELATVKHQGVDKVGQPYMEQPLAQQWDRPLATRAKRRAQSNRSRPRIVARAGRTDRGTNQRAAALAGGRG